MRSWRASYHGGRLGSAPRGPVAQLVEHRTENAGVASSTLAWATTYSAIRARSDDTPPMFDWISDPQAWIALATLTALEIVLGIDNIVFISILSDKLPPEQQAAGAHDRARARDVRPRRAPALDRVDHAAHRDLFEICGEGFSGRDLILIAGGLFLIGKSTFEIHEKMEGGSAPRRADRGARSPP